jgi:hypothetical protein
MVHGDCKIALECEEGDVAYAKMACAAAELKFYKDDVDLADMIPPKKPTIKKDPLLKSQSAKDTQQVEFVSGDSSQ